MQAVQLRKRPVFQGKALQSPICGAARRAFGWREFAAGAATRWRYAGHLLGLLLQAAGRRHGNGRRLPQPGHHEHRAAGHGQRRARAMAPRRGCANSLATNVS